MFRYNIKKDMSSIVSIDTRGYDISMGPGVLRVGGGGGLAGNVYINGNVGIGVINPTARLDVSGLIQSSITGASSFAQLIRNTTGEGAGWNSRFTIVPYLSTGGYSNLSTLGDVGIIWGAITGSNGNLVIAPHSAIGGGLKITSTGNVGIGTTSPSRLLDVRGDAQIGVSTNKCIEIISGTTDLTYINFHSKDVSYNNYDTRITSTGGSTSGQTQRGNLIYSALNHAFNIGGVDRMTITSNGNVGIGTTSPAATLDVSGTTATNKMLIRTSDYSYSLATQIYTANTWYQAVPTGILTEGMTYIVTLKFSASNTPWALTTSFLFHAVLTNGDNNSVGAAVPTAAHNTGASDYQIYVRGKTSGNVISGIEFKVSSTTSTGDWVVRVYRII